MDNQTLINEGYVDGKKSFDFLIEKIFKSFDFKKVYKVMKALDWHWHIHDENYGIPRIDTLKKEARRLLFEVYEQGKGSISTGGFSAGYEDGELWLSFSIEECHTCDL